MSDVNIPLPVAGREQPTATYRADAEGVTVRLDFKRRPEAWAEVRISLEEITRMQAAVTLTGIHDDPPANWTAEDILRNAG